MVNFDHLFNLQNKQQSPLRTLCLRGEKEPSAEFRSQHSALIISLYFPELAFDGAFIGCRASLGSRLGRAVAGHVIEPRPASARRRLLLGVHRLADLLHRRA